MLYNFKIYKKHYLENLALSIPVILSQVGQVVVQIVDNAMVGRLGATELAASSFAGAIFFILFVLVMGLTMGITPLVGEKFSTMAHRQSAILLQNGLVLYIAIGLIIFTIQQATIPLLSHFGQPQEVVEIAIPYYKTLVWSMLPFMVFSTFKQFFEGIGNTKVTMVVIITTNIINIIGNYILIFGNFGSPKLGVLGAGVSTLISRILMPILIIGYFFYKDNFKRYSKFFNRDNFSIERVIQLFKVGFPISMQIFLEVLAFTFCGIMAGWIGTKEIAANQIAYTMSSFAFMAVVGVSTATTIRVSHELGSGNLKEMNRATIAAYHIGIMWNFCTALTFISLRNYIPQIFTNDSEVISIASRLLIFVGLFQFCDGIQCISVGALRGIKDVNIIMTNSFICYIVISMPISYCLTNYTAMGINGIWTGLIIGLTIASISLTSRYFSQYKKLRLRKI